MLSEELESFSNCHGRCRGRLGPRKDDFEVQGCTRARAYVNLHMNGLPLRPDRQTKPRMCPLSPDGDANEHEQGHDNGVLHCLPRHKILIFASPHPCTTHTLPRLTFAACLMLARLIAVLCERQRVFLVGIFLDSRAAWRRHFSPRSFTSFGLDLVLIVHTRENQES